VKAAVKRLLVVGGTGFIGTHICRTAIAMGYAVVSLSLNSPRTSVAGVEYLIADLADAAAVKNAISGHSFEYVINCGGYIDHRPFRDGGRALINSHFDGVQNLVQSLDRSRLLKFVQIGSSDEYGDAAAPQNENLREMPIAPYSTGKVAATHFLQMLWRTERFPAAVLRLFLTYGPGQDRKRFIPQLISGCLAGTPFPVSEGNQVRDFCYVEDIVSGILRTLEVQAACGAVINLASGAPVTIRTVIEQVQALIGRGKPEFGRIAYRAGENMALYANIETAASVLAWTPRFSLAEGLARTIAYYRDASHG
jgi:nucleoside-diphosphate-sugar epimerase